MLQIANIKATIENRQILNGISLQVKPGEVHAIMGPNGSGKSTLSKVIAGHPAYTVTEGDMTYKGQSILDKSPNERAVQGIFLSFQYPVEIPGVNNASFLRMAYNTRRKYLGQDEVDPFEFDAILQQTLDNLEMEGDFADRAVNVGFSGGEKKKNEIVQMAILNPDLAILDETDSGLDIDALRIVSKGINQLKRPDNAIILITHYQRLLNYIVPDYVHVIANGQIIRSGDKSLAYELEEKGYDWLLPESVSEGAVK